MSMAVRCHAAMATPTCKAHLRSTRHEPRFVVSRTDQIEMRLHRGVSATDVDHTAAGQDRRVSKWIKPVAPRTHCGSNAGCTIRDALYRWSRRRGHAGHP